MRAVERRGTHARLVRCDVLTAGNWWPPEESPDRRWLTGFLEPGWRCRHQDCRIWMEYITVHNLITILSRTPEAVEVSTCLSEDGLYDLT